MTDRDELPGIAIEHLSRVISERIVKSGHIDTDQINALVWDSLRDVVGWKLFSKNDAQVSV